MRGECLRELTGDDVEVARVVGDGGLGGHTIRRGDLDVRAGVRRRSVGLVERAGELEAGSSGADVIGKVTTGDHARLTGVGGVSSGVDVLNAGSRGAVDAAVSGWAFQTPQIRIRFGVGWARNPDGAGYEESGEGQGCFIHKVPRRGHCNGLVNASGDAPCKP